MANATGGTITTSGGNTIHTFTSDADFVVPAGYSGTVTYFIVGAGSHGDDGAAGVNWGSGGAGGQVRTASVVIAGGTYAVVRGAAGATGGNSTFNGVTALGGSAPGDGQTGGGNTDYTGGTGASLDGGGGAGSANNGSVSVGGEGTTSSISGASYVYASGGGGAKQLAPGGAGGTGAGNGGSTDVTAGGNATNYGAGGGGGPAGLPGNGANGVVIISYVTDSFLQSSKSLFFQQI